MTAWEGGVVSIGTVSELLPAETPVTAEVLNGGLGKTVAEWKMTAWEGGVVSIGTVSELLPAEAPVTAEAVNRGLGKTGAEAVNGRLEKTGAPGREALCCPSEVPNMG